MITIQQNPSSISPAYNPLVYVVSSNKVTQPNFIFVCDITVGGDTIRVKHSPDPVGSYGVFDIHRIVENYVSADDLSTGEQGRFSTGLNNLVSYQVAFGEEFGLSTTGTTVYPSQVTDSARYAFNAILDPMQFRFYNQSNYLVSGASTTKTFLTNSPDTLTIRADEDAWLYSMTTTSGSIYYAEIKTYTSAGVLIDTFRIENNDQDISSSATYINRLAIGTYNLDNVAALALGSAPVLPATVSYYTVKLIKFDGTQTSETKRFNISDDCTEHEVFRLSFLNKLGGFDSFTFIKASTKTIDISRNRFKKDIGSLSGAVWSIDGSARAETTYNTDITKRVVLNSDWITDDEAVWLEELVTSPIVLLHNTTYSTFEAVNIIDSNYVTRKSLTDKVFNLRVTIEYSSTTNRQRA